MHHRINWIFRLIYHKNLDGIEMNKHFTLLTQFDKKEKKTSAKLKIKIIKKYEFLDVFWLIQTYCSEISCLHSEFAVNKRKKLIASNMIWQILQFSSVSTTKCEPFLGWKLPTYSLFMFKQLLEMVITKMKNKTRNEGTQLIFAILR